MDDCRHVHFERSFQRERYGGAVDVAETPAVSEILSGSLSAQASPGVLLGRFFNTSATNKGFQKEV